MTTTTTDKIAALHAEMTAELATLTARHTAKELTWGEYRWRAAHIRQDYAEQAVALRRQERRRARRVRRAA